MSTVCDFAHNSFLLWELAQNVAVEVGLLFEPAGSNELVDNLAVFGQIRAMIKSKSGTQ